MATALPLPAPHTLLVNHTSILHWQTSPLSPVLQSLKGHATSRIIKCYEILQAHFGHASNTVINRFHLNNLHWVVHTLNGPGSPSEPELACDSKLNVAAIFLLPADPRRARRELSMNSEGEAKIASSWPSIPACVAPHSDTQRSVSRSHHLYNSIMSAWLLT